MNQNDTTYNNFRGGPCDSTLSDFDLKNDLQIRPSDKPKPKKKGESETQKKK